MIDVGAAGDVTITAEDDEGLRRAVYYYQDRVRAGDLRSCVRRPWLRNRISRNFFTPIKRPPFNEDELMDDIDYYPEPYLDRLAHEGVNGLWITVSWRELANTSFTRCGPDAERRLAKLRRTIARCAKYGIRVWAFCIEPAAVPEDDPLVKAHPELFGAAGGGRRYFCTSSPAACRYIEESVRDIFTQAPGLGGVLAISYGERGTMCFGQIDATDKFRRGRCPRCDLREPWELYRPYAESVVRGIRAAGSSAEFASWFYMPQPNPVRHPWVAACSERLPDGVTLIGNFESGALREQLGRYRVGGDYWQSFVGPSTGFRDLAQAGVAAGHRIGAKIQVGNSHECATVPFVPVPGLLYRKYRAMRELGVSTVLQCWYFGNCPGIMNKAAGELAYEDFADGEDAFLKRLAAPYWGEDTEAVAGVWKAFSDAYAEYPLSNNMQYYGPFHAGVAWPLYADVELLPLGRTWMPLDAPSGDRICEALENHTLEEASILAGRMVRGVQLKDEQGRDTLDVLSERWKDDPERTRDLNVMRALRLQFESAADIFTFYLDRARAVHASRTFGDAAAALAAVARMKATVAREEDVTRRMLPLAKADSRLGFHSEAARHQYHPAKLEWRLGTLAETKRRLDEIAAELAAGRPYPESAFERSAPRVKVGAWTDGRDGLRFRLTEADNGDLTFEVEYPAERTVYLSTADRAGVQFDRELILEPDGEVKVRNVNRIAPGLEVVGSRADVGADKVRLTLTVSAASWGGRIDRRPEWIGFSYIAEDGYRFLWPTNVGGPVGARLNLGQNEARRFGRIIRRESPGKGLQ